MPDKLKQWWNIQVVAWSFWITAVTGLFRDDDDDEPPTAGATVTGYGLQGAVA